MFVMVRRQRIPGVGGDPRLEQLVWSLDAHELANNAANLTPIVIPYDLCSTPAKNASVPSGNMLH